MQILLQSNSFFNIEEYIVFVVIQYYLSFSETESVGILSETWYIG